MTGMIIAQVLAILYPIVLATAMVLAFRRRTRPAAALTTLVGASFMAWNVPTVLEWLRDSEAFTRKYGRAALGQVPLAAAIVGGAVAVIALSVLAVVWKRHVFWAAWALCWLPAALLFWLAFFFKLF